MNTQQRKKECQTAQYKKDTKQLGLSKSKANNSICFKPSGPTHEFIDIAEITDEEGKRFGISFLRRGLQRKDEMTKKLEELKNLNALQILEMCARMIVMIDSLKNQEKKEEKKNE